MKRRALPPLVGEIKDGEVTWQRIEDVDYETLGYLLSCHLIIEHYVSEELKSVSTPLGEGLQWHSTKLSFNQKISLLPDMTAHEPYNFIPCIKHLNSLRNKFGHDISFKLSDSDLAPFIQFLAKIYKAPKYSPKGTIAILEGFTSVTCAWFASSISHRARSLKR